jgi:purine-binding chemotaxis protein CheW
MTDEDLLQFVSFRLGGQEFAVEMLQLRRVLPYEVPTPVAGAPGFLAGTLCHLGDTFAVLDVRGRLDLPTDVTPETRLLVLDHGSTPVMLVVDAARDVVRAEAGSIGAAPAVAGLAPGQTLGLIDWAGRPIVILNPARLLSAAERAALDAMVRAS